MLSIYVYIFYVLDSRPFKYFQFWIPKRWFAHFLWHFNFLLTVNKICKSKLQAIFFQSFEYVMLFHYTIGLVVNIDCIWLEVYWYSDQVYWPSSFLETRPRYKKSASFFMLLNERLLAAVSRWHVPLDFHKSTLLLCSCQQKWICISSSRIVRILLL